MKQKLKPIRKSDIPVYEHLEHHLRKTTYAHRWQWLQQANDFVYLLQKKKIIPVRSK